jgi:class III poly(R)-hydroxyalkanoic acid synthase PhaE subunit
METMDKNSSPASPWIEALEMWWQALAPSTPPEHRQVLRKLIDQGKSYFALNGEFLKAFQQAPKEEMLPEEWQKLWENGFATLKENFENLYDSQKHYAAWEAPLNDWQKTAASLSLLPIDHLRNFQDQNSQTAHEIFGAHLQPLLNVPKLGYTREWQERQQEMSQLWIQYQEAQQAYSTVFSKIGIRTINLMQAKVLAIHNSDNPDLEISRLRDLYNLWVECGEAAYAETVVTPEFAEVNAHLINTLMAWKRHQRLVVDEFAGMMNMPTRCELDTLSLRMQQLRRENKELQAEQDGSVLDDVRQELYSLRDEVEMLKHILKKQQTTSPNNLLARMNPSCVNTPKKTVKKTSTEAEMPIKDTTKGNK